MMLNLIQPGEADKVLLAIKDRLHEFEIRIQIQNSEVERIRKSYNEELKKLEHFYLIKFLFLKIYLIEIISA